VSIKPFSENVIYDIGKLAVGVLINKVIERVRTNLKNNQEPKTKKLTYKVEPFFLQETTTFIDFRLNEKAKIK